MPQIRNEVKRDYQAVEELTRRAFYNLYVPGCVEHYLVHIMREHEDFIQELDFVLEEDGRIIGNIMYTKAKLVDETGREKKILTFGPVCVEPDLQRQGYGKQLMEHSFTKAVERCHRHLRQSRKLCLPRVPKLPKISGPCGGREVSRGHAGEGADPRRSDGSPVDLFRQPGDGDPRGGSPALR